MHIQVNSIVIRQVVIRLLSSLLLKLKVFILTDFVMKVVVILIMLKVIPFLILLVTLLKFQDLYHVILRNHYHNRKFFLSLPPFSLLLVFDSHLFIPPCSHLSFLLPLLILTMLNFILLSSLLPILVVLIIRESIIIELVLQILVVLRLILQFLEN